MSRKEFNKATRDILAAAWGSPKRGRPKGSKNAVSRPHWLQVRLTEDLKGWLLSKAVPPKTMSDIVVRLLEEARKRDP